MKVVLVQGVLAKLVTWRVHRGELIYKQWKRLKSLLLPQKPRTDRPAHDHRVLVDGIPWALL